MSRRTVAGLLALGLIVLLGGYGATRTSGYVTLKPGPTINVLGEFDGKQIIKITGHKTYRDEGGLRMVTVYQSQPQQKITLADMVFGWVDPDVALIPYDIVFPDKKTTDKQVQQQSAAEMTSSQDAARAAALTALGVDYRIDVRVSLVAKGGASDGKLRTGDVFVAVDGKDPGHGPDSGTKLVQSIRAVKPGTPITVTVRRNGVEKQVRIVTEKAADDPKASRINVGVEQRYIFPFSVDIRLSDSIGGPSAGMMFALSIYDLLTPGSLTGGKMIAGTGTIDPDGTVGSIGGIGQKIVGAQRDGARLFLVPAENCAEAARSHYDTGKIRLVKVSKLADAIEDIDAWRANPEADLPRCTR
ncbi:MAG: PDZ domain-containing protein [Nocardioidaceae bacterium]|nr:PDZ domain-containing protein [Nocardioidaceae bacterium]